MPPVQASGVSGITAGGYHGFAEVAGTLTTTANISTTYTYGYDRLYQLTSASDGTVTTTYATTP